MRSLSATSNRSRPSTAKSVAWSDEIEEQKKREEEAEEEEAAKKKPAGGRHDSHLPNLVEVVLDTLLSVF